MAEILPNTSNDIGNRGCTNTTLAQFKGKPRQVLVNIDDAYRLIVMDGSTLGGKFKAASLDELNSVKNTANSALTKTLADGYYLAKTGKATTAGTADRANALTTARSIGITGAVTGAGVSFNGTANININTTAVDGTKVSTFTAATTSTAGTVGAVPAPSAGAQAKFLRGDGTWQVPTNTDTKVVQTPSTTAGEYALLAKDNTGVTTTTSGSVFSDGVTVNPNTKTITASIFKGSLHGNATSATKATNATKASQDASGNDIPTTYATKAEVTSGLSGKLDKTAKATSATTADSASSVPWAGVSGKPQLIPGTGDAGTIKTYETVVAATTVSDSSARSMSLANSGSLTVSNGSANKAWITVVALAGTATITLGSSWSWSGSTPTLAKGLVTLAWYGTFGVATFTKFGS